MDNYRDFINEAKAMATVMQSLYNEKKYLEGIRDGEDSGEFTSERKAQLKLVDHFIKMYEGLIER